MTAIELDYLYLVIGAMSAFAVVLAWAEWYSKRS